MCGTRRTVYQVFHNVLGSFIAGTIENLSSWHSCYPRSQNRDPSTSLRAGSPPHEPGPVRGDPGSPPREPGPFAGTPALGDPILRGDRLFRFLLSAGFWRRRRCAQSAFRASSLRFFWGLEPVSLAARASRFTSRDFRMTLRYMKPKLR